MDHPRPSPSVIERQPLRRRDHYFRMASLSLVTSPIVGAYVFGHGGGSSPLFCPVLAVTGIPCPGCGMTRSFIALARGDLEGAIAFHLFGPLVFLAAVGVALHLSIELTTGQRIRYPALAQWLQRRRVDGAAVLLLFLYHSIRLWNLNQSGALAASIAAAPLHRILTGL